MRLLAVIAIIMLSFSTYAQEFSSLMNINDRLKLNPAQGLINKSNHGFTDFQKVDFRCNQVADYLVTASVDNLNSENIIDTEGIQTRGNLRLGSFRFAGGINYERTGSRQFNYHQIGFSLAYGVTITNRLNLTFGGETGFSWHKFRTETPSMFEFYLPTSPTISKSVSPINLAYGFQFNRTPKKTWIDKTYLGFTYRTQGIPQEITGNRTHQFTTYAGFALGKRIQYPYVRSKSLTFRIIYRENLVRGQAQRDFNGNPFSAYRHLTFNLAFMLNSSLGVTASYQDYLNGFRTVGTEFVYLRSKTRFTAGTSYNINHNFIGVNMSGVFVLDHCRRGHKHPHRSYHLSF